eukprot:5280019-Amphidinium_carterae.2
MRPNSKPTGLAPYAKLCLCFSCLACYTNGFLEIMFLQAITGRSTSAQENESCAILCLAQNITQVPGALERVLHVANFLLQQQRNCTAACGDFPSAPTLPVISGRDNLQLALHIFTVKHTSSPHTNSRA